jgi:hypothetical protein
MRPLTTLAALWLAAAPTLAQAQEPQPVAGAARATTATEQTGFFAEPDIIAKTIRTGTKWLGGDDGAIKSGFYADIGGMITGAGWISGGPGYRQWLFGDRMLVDGSAQLSWRMYKLVQGRIEWPALAGQRLIAGVEGRWQDLTQVSYFGAGPDSLETNRSEYALEYANGAAYLTGMPVSWLALKARVGWISEPSIKPPGGTFARGFADVATVFPDDPVYSLPKQPQYMVVSGLAIADTRDHRGYPTRGGLYQAAWSRYTDRPLDRFTFQRYEAEAAQFVPLASGRIIMIGHAWLAGTRAESDRVVPFYLQPSLGGTNTLRSYSDYRFHDRNLVVVNAEARFRLFTHVDAAVFADAGNVGSTIGDLNLAHRSYGGGLRLHTDRTTIARFDAAHGAEGWRLLFRMNDPFRFSRLTKRISPIPFSP